MPICVNQTKKLKKSRAHPGSAIKPIRCRPRRARAACRRGRPSRRWRPRHRCGPTPPLEAAPLLRARAAFAAHSDLSRWRLAAAGGHAAVAGPCRYCRAASPLGKARRAACCSGERERRSGGVRIWANGHRYRPALHLLGCAAARGGQPNSPLLQREGEDTTTKNLTKAGRND